MIVRLPSAVGLAVPLACVAAMLALGAGAARAESTWRLEQPAPPAAPAGVAEAPGPVGLGKVGDIEFFSPNRGVLITAGNPPTIPAGVWIYNGQDWRELSNKCGASDGRIAWAGPTEFWTISNGRPGQAEVDHRIPLLTDDTLCRFADGKIVESFAAPAYEADSYMPMHAAACLSPEDCWFGGDSLPQEGSETGAFQLHWNGAGLSEVPYPDEGHAIEEMRDFDSRIYESVRLLQEDPGKQPPVPPALRVFNPELPGAFQPEHALNRQTLYGAEAHPFALDYLHLSAGAAGLWAAAGKRPNSEESAPVTVLRYTPEAEVEWTQLLGPSTSPSGEEAFPGQTVEALAAEPGSGEEQAWLGLQSDAEALESERGSAAVSTRATLARISASGAISSEETLPSASEGGVGPKGPVTKLSCPAPGDCWMVTSAGWLFHLAPEGERTLPEDTGSGFTGLIAERPEDQGLPQTQPDTVPPDDSGLAGEIPALTPVPAVHKAQEELRVPVALVSGIRTRLVHGTTLEMHFHLAVKARIQLIAKRKHRVVAKTATHTFGAGEHKLLLSLNRKLWPTQLHLVEHPLAPLPTVSAKAGDSETVTTQSLAFPSHLPLTLGLP